MLLSVSWGSQSKLWYYEIGTCLQDNITYQTADKNYMTLACKWRRPGHNTSQTSSTYLETYANRLRWRWPLALPRWQFPLKKKILIPIKESPSWWASSHHSSGNPNHFWWYGGHVVTWDAFRRPWDVFLDDTTNKRNGETMTSFLNHPAHMFRRLQLAVAVLILDD